MEVVPVNVKAIVLPLVALAMVAIGAFSNGLSDAVAVALIVIGAGMFFIGSLAPTLTEFQIGPGGFSAKLRERDREVQTALEPDQENLIRMATWLGGSPQAGKELAEEALIETYMRWREARREGPADAVRERLVGLAPHEKQEPAPASATSAPDKGHANDLLAKVGDLPAGERSALVLHLLGDMGVDAVASAMRREAPSVAKDIERAASTLLPIVESASEGAS